MADWNEPGRSPPWWENVSLSVPTSTLCFSVTTRTSIFAAIMKSGNHEENSESSLEPAGKTNEAAALDYLRHHYLDLPRQRKIVIVLSDGLPTACSVESVCGLTRSLEKDLGVRFLHGTCPPRCILRIGGGRILRGI